jgi:hypothetical protein
MHRNLNKIVMKSASGRNCMFMISAFVQYCTTCEKVIQVGNQKFSAFLHWRSYYLFFRPNIPSRARISKPLMRRGIDTQPGRPVRQPYLTYRRAGPTGYICWRNRFLGSLNVYKFALGMSLVCHGPATFPPLNEAETF